MRGVMLWCSGHGAKSYINAKRKGQYIITTQNILQKEKDNVSLLLKTYCKKKRTNILAYLCPYKKMINTYLKMIMK